jgi:hypothetical protein
VNLNRAAERAWLPGLLALYIALGCGCTSALWEKDTFARRYQPANPTGLHLFYSEKRQDILVQYTESKNGNTNARTRCYWLEPNTSRVSEGKKPRFISVKAAIGLTPIPVGETAPCPAGQTQLYALARLDDSYFTLFSGEETMDRFNLPNYAGSSQRVKQILLTPVVLVIDATMIGAVAACLSAPQILAGLSQCH